MAQKITKQRLPAQSKRIWTTSDIKRGGQTDSPTFWLNLAKPKIRKSVETQILPPTVRGGLKTASDNETLQAALGLDPGHTCRW